MAKKFIPIELDKVRNLRYGMQSLMLLEDKLGKPLASIDFNNELRYKDVCTIVWAGLHWEDKSLSLDGVAQLIDDYSDIPTVIEAMTTAMNEAFGGGKIEEGKK